MKKLTVILFFTILSFSVSAQRSADYGIYGGVTSYLGDINPGRLLYRPQPAGGIFYRYNLHPRQAVRANLMIGGLKGYDSDFTNTFQVKRNDYFKGFVAEGAIQFEFNFIPYSTQSKNLNYTPYFAAGVGVSNLYIDTFIWDPVNGSYNDVVPIRKLKPIIPFSIGFKVNIAKNLGLEVEYGFRKTFYDNFDGLTENIDPQHKNKAWLHNNDWYSFAGVAFTWKIYNKLVRCPAYNDVDAPRRR
jgi:hypothetical protein